MRRNVIALTLIAVASGFAAAQLAQAADPPASYAELTVVTFNVMVDITPTPGVPGWDKRKELCARVLREASAELVGLQEPSPAQLKFLMDEVPGYETVFHKGYPDAALLFKKESFVEEARGEWWLSPTPERVSVGYGNVLPRLVVWAKLRHRACDKSLYVFVTHFDNTRPCQQKMAELCAERLAPYMEQGLPMIFMGDFNTDQNRGDYPQLTSRGWQDTYKICPAATATGRDDNVPTTLDGARIDHIFYHGRELTPESWRRLESPDSATPLSDHYPVLARLRWN